jgi:NAD(P)H-dependent flavin oxidoreductase YrpB (nitropropane dioxygenase family)
MQLRKTNGAIGARKSKVRWHDLQVRHDPHLQGHRHPATSQGVGSDAMRDDRTAITNIFTGRAARAMVNRIAGELGPMSEHAPAFPAAGAALAPLRAKAETAGSDDFTPLWSGQGARLGRELPARQLTTLLAEEAVAVDGRTQRK